MATIREIIIRHQDEEYGDFIAKLVPTLERERFIGIRSPEYKKIVKEIKNEAKDQIEDFLNTLPHEYHEENALHTVLICDIRDYDECMSRLEAFLPYVDNWAISDSIGPKVFEKNKDRLVEKVREWINSPKPYTIRVAMRCIMKYYLDSDFKKEYLEWAATIRTDEYYVNMMTAWLFAEALAKQWDTAIVFIEGNALDVWTHNKAIQKARESYRISPEQKEYLKSLKRK